MGLFGECEMSTDHWELTPQQSKHREGIALKRSSRLRRAIAVVAAACLLSIVAPALSAQAADTFAAVGSIATGTGTNPTTITVNSATHRLYAANLSTRNVFVYDTTDDANIKVATIPAAGQVTGTPQSITVDATRNVVYLATSSFVYVIDGASNTITGTLSVTNGYSIAVNEVTNVVYVARSAGSSQIARIDIANGNAITYQSLGGYPGTSVAVNEVTNQVFVGRDVSASQFYKLDGTNLAILQNATVGARATRSIAVDETRDRVYTATQASTTVSVFDAADITTPLPSSLGNGSVIGQFRMTVDSARNLVYSPGFGANILNVFNGATLDGADTKTYSQGAGAQPSDVAMTSDGNRVYVANYGTNSIAVYGWGAAPAMTPPTLPDALQGAAYAQTVTATGGTPITFAIQTGTLPAGLTFDTTTGAITGTPTAPLGSYSFTISASNPWGLATQPYTIHVVAPPAITTATLPDGVVGTAYSQTLVATGTAPISYSVDSGALPAGLTLNGATGSISGTPTSASSSTFTIRATNTAGTSTHQYTVVVRTAPAIATTTLPDAALGTVYSHTVEATGSAPISFAVASGALPAGLVLNPATGAVTGTPTALGVSTFTISATNAAGTANQPFTVTVRQLPVISTTSIADGVLGSAYTQTIAATGTAPIVFTVSAGDLPAGLTLNGASGVIDGTPTAAGTSNFSITASNAAGTDTKSYVLVVRQAPEITTTSLPGGVVGDAYSQQISATGTGPIAFAITAGSLPDGLSLDVNTGDISGTLTTPASSTFTVTATNSVGTSSQSLTIDVTPAPVAPTITTTTLDDGIIGVAYSQDIGASGSAPIVFALAAGDSLPAGLSLDADTGSITGTPSVAATNTFTITATNAVGTTSQTYTVTVRDVPVITTTTLPDGVVGTAYSQSVAVTGTAPISFALGVGDSLPAGLALEPSTGTISGTPTAVGTSTFTIIATNAAGADAESYSVVVREAPAITTTTLADGVVGTAYSQSVVATGTGPITFSVSSGDLPAGLGLNSATGEISGNPTAAGTFAFNVTASSAAGSAVQSFSVIVREVPAITTASLPGGTDGAAYSASVAASGTAPITFSDGATLPDGLAIDPATGAVTGTPTTAGTFAVTITATNAAGSDTADFSIVIGPAPSAPIITTITLPAGVAGTSYFKQIGATGTAPITFAVVGGALPDGVTLDAATGELSGTPTTKGSYEFQLRATNGVGSLTAIFTLEVAAGPASLTTSTIVARTPVLADGIDAGAVLVSVFDAYGNVVTDPVDVRIAATAPGLVSSVTSNGDGTYSATVTSSVVGSVSLGFSLDQVTAAASTSVSFIAPPPPPIVNPTNGKSVTGTTVPGTSVKVALADGSPVPGTIAVAGDGSFTFTPSTPLADKMALVFTAVDEFGYSSTPTDAVVDAAAPAVPVVEPSDGSSVGGVAEPGSTVTVTGPSGDVLCTTTADASSGAFSCDFNPALANGTVLQVVATDSLGNQSASASVTVIWPPLPGSPSLELRSQSLAQGQTQIAYGHNFKPGESVNGVLASDPIDLGTQLADADGNVTFTFTVPTDLVVGSHSVTLTGAFSGSVSQAFEVTAASSGAGGDGAGGGGFHLPGTGANLAPILIGAGVLLIAGLVLVLLRRGRSRD